MIRAQRTTERAATTTNREILAGIDQIHRLGVDEVEKRTTEAIRRYIRDAYIAAWIIEAEDLEDMFGDVLLAAFLIRLHNILKNGPDPELIRTAEKYVASISYTATQNYRLVGKQIRPATPEKHNLRGVVHRHFLLYRKHIDDIDAADLSKSEKRDLTKWRTGQHGESGLGYRLTTLTRTEGDTAQAAASVDVYEEAGIERYKYNAMLDDKTCKVCRDLNGRIFKISEKQPGVNFPPIHRNCRCYTEPVI